MSIISNADFSSGLAHKICCAWAAANGTPAELNCLGENGAMISQILQVLRGQCTFAPIEQKAQVGEETVDSIIRVDRVYPDWVQEVIHPELETMGPAEYDIKNVEQWLHTEQERGDVEGYVIYKDLQETDTLKDQLGLVDLLAIKEKGRAFFRKYFSGKSVFGWKSVVRDHDGSLCVPYLVDGWGNLVVGWDRLDEGWSSFRPGLRFTSQS